MLCAKINKCIHVGVGVFPIGVAPLAEVLVELAVRLSARGLVLERHPAALAHELVRRAQKRVYRHIEKLR